MKTSDDFISFSYQTITQFNQDFIGSRMGKCPFKPGSIQGLLNLLAICSYNLEEVENCGSHVLVSSESLRNPPGNHKRRRHLTSCKQALSRREHSGK